MPHISIKMLSGRTEDQKKRVSAALAETLKKELNVPEKYISVSIEDYTAGEWQNVFKEEIADKKDKVYIQPKYKPEELL
jgi:4-oxalocrotonate tautomerase